jgi:hypothetical protein
MRLHDCTAAHIEYMSAHRIHARHHRPPYTQDCGTHRRMQLLIEAIPSKTA